MTSFKKLYKQGASLLCLSGAAVLVLAACSDFSDYNEVRTDAAATGNQTLWENIRQNSQLSDFAALVQKATRPC